MAIEGNLGLRSIRLSPAEERRIDGEGFAFLMLLQGQAYWLENDSSAFIEPRTVMIASCSAGGQLRSGRFEVSHLVIFNLRLECLMGLLSLREYQGIQTWLQEENLPLTLPKDHAASRLMRDQAEMGRLVSLSGRIDALRILALAFQASGYEKQLAAATLAGHSCESRMKRHFDLLTVAEVDDCSLDRLAVICGCSSRHASRVFRRCYGGSLREKQTEIRFGRAVELLKQGDLSLERIAVTKGFGDGAQF